IKNSNTRKIQCFIEEVKSKYSGSNKIVTPLGRPARPRPFCRRGLPSRPSCSALSAMSALSAKVFGHAGLVGQVVQPYRPCGPALSAMPA
ncbi:hypothetical protein BpHYR1_039069, partial [Brachionus plicatilis]